MAVFVTHCIIMIPSKCNIFKSGLLIFIKNNTSSLINCLLDCDVHPFRARIYFRDRCCGVLFPTSQHYTTYYLLSVYTWVIQDFLWHLVAVGRTSHKHSRHMLNVYRKFAKTFQIWTLKNLFSYFCVIKLENNNKFHYKIFEWEKKLI